MNFTKAAGMNQTVMQEANQTTEAVKVVIRSRPFNNHEIDNGHESVCIFS